MEAGSHTHTHTLIIMQDLLVKSMMCIEKCDIFGGGNGYVVPSFFSCSLIISSPHAGMRPGYAVVAIQSLTHLFRCVMQCTWMRWGIPLYMLWACVRWNRRRFSRANPISAKICLHIVVLFSTVCVFAVCVCVMWRSRRMQSPKQINAPKITRSRNISPHCRV